MKNLERISSLYELQDSASEVFTSATDPYELESLFPTVILPLADDEPPLGSLTFNLKDWQVLDFHNEVSKLGTGERSTFSFWIPLYFGLKRQLKECLSSHYLGYQIFTYKKKHFCSEHTEKATFGSWVFDAPTEMFDETGLLRDSFQQKISSADISFVSSALLAKDTAKQLLFYWGEQPKGFADNAVRLLVAEKDGEVFCSFDKSGDKNVGFLVELGLIDSNQATSDSNAIENGLGFMLTNAIHSFKQKYGKDSACLPESGGVLYTPTLYKGNNEVASATLVFYGYSVSGEQHPPVDAISSITRSWGLKLETIVRLILEKSRMERDKKIILSASVKSAIGSIMSRNGSHNIGSHVLSALSHNVGTMPDDRVLYQYIQHRMDYIASATTGAVDWSVPTPFVGNLMKMFYSQHHLLEHIAESDGLHAYLYQGKGTQFGEGQNNCVKIVVRRISHTSKEGWNHKKVFGKDVWMYSFFHEDAAKKVETDTNGERIRSDVTDKPVVWKNDEDVSVPGGILGQHAFYNIVENVIRNAAKHSWAAQHSWAAKSEAERGAQNLEIYVDFKKDLDDKTMCFTVGDNMSRLFFEDFWNDAFSYLASSENSIKLPQGVSSWPEFFAQPLDGFIVPSNAKASNCQKVKDFLDGKGTLADLPPQYKALCDYVVKKWDDLKSKESFKAILKGSPDKDENDHEIDELGHRLPLPLHHRQELTLAEPFIDLETNRLRQSAWGLSEMKISAGYLRRADVSVIGGLQSLKSEQGKAQHPLIVPIGIPSGGNGGENLWKDLCLAYRFWIALPKDVLIVADHEDKWARFSGAGWEGIGVISYKSVFGGDETKGDIGLMSDYGFVVVDHGEKIKPEDQLKLPFRYLVVDGDETQARVAREKLEQTATAKDLVKCVYRSWLDHLKKRRGAAEKKFLAIKLHIYAEDGGEKGLINDRDIYKVLFRECLHSVLEPLADDDLHIEALQRKALLLISLYPLAENDELFKDIPEKINGNHRRIIVRLLGTIAGKVRQFLEVRHCASLEDCDKDQMTKMYRIALERAKGTMEDRIVVEDLLSLVNHSPCNAWDRNMSYLSRELSSMAEEPLKSTALKLASEALDVARTTSDVFLRKYEERISTLPQQYKGSGTPKEAAPDFTSFGVKITYGENGQEFDISYNRHATDGASLYSEPLSGSQSYLNALSNLSDDDSQWAMRLAENGLLRIAIIDERVRAFIAEHGDDIKKTYASMHIAVVDTEQKPNFNPEETTFPDLTKLPFVVRNASDTDYDLVVIHQGVIDKWWPNKHDRKDVSKILSSLRESGKTGQSRFVAVTTGRGRPDNIPDNEKVLAFSSVEAFLFKRYPEKLNLVNSLMSILPGSPERNDDNG